MSLLSIVVLVLGNVSWALACLSLLMTQGQVNALVGWTGFQVGGSPAAYLPLFLIIALGFQIILFYLISKMESKKKSLSSKYREVRTEKQTLEETAAMKERELLNQSKMLQKTQNELTKLKEEKPKEPWWKGIWPQK
ncbi:MAG: hypothetical protein ABL890_04400 [Candidatus Peribacteraceae bacterium]